jgi:hypothetical protein
MRGGSPASREPGRGIVTITTGCERCGSWLEGGALDAEFPRLRLGRQMPRMHARQVRVLQMLLVEGF